MKATILAHYIKNIHQPDFSTKVKAHERQLMPAGTVSSLRRGYAHPNKFTRLISLTITLLNHLLRTGLKTVLHAEDVDLEDFLEFFFGGFEEAFDGCYACVGYSVSSQEDQYQYWFVRAS